VNVNTNLPHLSKFQEVQPELNWNVGRERESLPQPLNPEASEFYYRAFPVEVKKEDVAHSTNREDEILRRFLKFSKKKYRECLLPRTK